MTMSKLSSLLFLAAPALPTLLAACADDGAGLPADPPSSVTLVAWGGFTAPTDAVSSPDGATFYFAARDGQGQPAIFSVSSEPGSTAHARQAGAPLAGPTGLVMSCDGATLYVADPSGVYSMPAAGGALTAVAVGGVDHATGLAMASDCTTLYATGRTTDDQPALFSFPTTGGIARIVHMGQPLVEPSGMFIDDLNVAWVMDALAAGQDGPGVLFAIPSDGSTATPVMSNLHMGSPGGVSLTAGGGTAVIPTRDVSNKTQLTTVKIATGAVVNVPAPDILAPAGIRVARGAGVFAVVDAAGDAIYRAD
ncbi:MAG TPA: hypothetical protein VHE35_35575 [Kofleriaceae bacterium]|nr:hypothetical protein [Kofleriaceae bacterium]